MTKSTSTLLALLRQSASPKSSLCEETLSFGLKAPEGEDLETLSPADWQEMIDLSFDQGVDAISVDGYHRSLTPDPSWPLPNPLLKERELKNNKSLPLGGDLEGALKGSEIAIETEELEDLKFEWFGSVLQAEEDYRSQKEAIASLARVYSEAGIRMMVLKGYGLSLNYPTPSHRPTGDIDVYLMEASPQPSPKGKGDKQSHPLGGDLEGAPAWKRGDEIIRRMGIKVDEGHEHHTTFSWSGFLVENHYDFVNTKVNGSSRELEREYKRLSADAFPMEVDGTTIYLPSAQFNALFLIRHIGQHFAGAEASLRQVLDWGYFVRACHSDIDWPEAMRSYRRAGIDRFVHQINAICVDHLGFDESLFPSIERDTPLQTRILEDILHPEFAESKPQGSTLKVVWFKTRRFLANRWKHRLVYRESIPSQFLHGSIAHLRRFGTIKD